MGEKQRSDSNIILILSLFACLSYINQQMQSPDAGDAENATLPLAAARPRSSKKSKSAKKNSLKPKKRKKMGDEDEEDDDA